VSLSRRRRAVHMLQQRLDLSERRACQIVGQHRSTQRHTPPERTRMGPKAVKSAMSNRPTFPPRRWIASMTASAEIGQEALA
jgi:hypothetical protein